MHSLPCCTPCTPSPCQSHSPLVPLEEGWGPVMAFMILELHESEENVHFFLKSRHLQFLRPISN